MTADEFWKKLVTEQGYPYPPTLQDHAIEDLKNKER